MTPSVVIIGGGVAGLVAALECEKANLQPLLLEATDRCGGRIKTDIQGGLRMDHGFQVLLTAYESAREYLDMDALQLKTFGSGAIVYDNGRSFRISDPLREPSTLLKMAFSPVGSLKDKLLVFQLVQQLKRTPREQLFSDKEAQLTTLEYLQQFGFSSKMINTFFRPFFGGIFLENALTTSAAMFRFVFKLFSEGEAAIPAKGMQQIPEQLQSQLKNTTIRFNSPVQTVEGNKILLQSGETINFDKLIIATDPSTILPNLKGQEVDYQQTANFYYTSDRSPIGSPLIGLVPDPKRIINNFCVLTDVSEAYSAGKETLISVTLKHIPEEDDVNINEQVARELRELSGQMDLPLQFVKRYDIWKALPDVAVLQYDSEATQFALTDDIFLAGDYLLNASLDAAMRSGKRAAQAMRMSL